MAHRGSSDELPENTLPAFARAIAQGAAVLETDIRFTRDDEIVLMHDGTIDRTTNGSGAVASMTLAELKQYRAERSFTNPTPLGSADIPTLAEFIQFTASLSPNPTNAEAGSAAQNGAAVPIALELKDDRFITPRDAERLVQLLSDTGALDRTILLSFHAARVRAVKQIASALPIGIITLKNPFPLYDTELMGPYYPLLYLNPFYFAWARRRGKIACPLDPAPEPRLGFYQRIGVPVLLTNHPAVTRRALDALGW